MIRTGIDEAGLGPVLGPYCGAGLGFEYSRGDKNPWEVCSSILSRKPEKGRLAVGDSKTIHSSGRAEVLEQTVLSFFRIFTGKTVSNSLDFLQELSPGIDSLLEGIPWYDKLSSRQLPLCSAGKGLPYKELEKILVQNGISPVYCELKICPAGSFNRLLSEWGNKAAACMSILAPLVSSCLGISDHVMVDRQGGRRYYQEWLNQLFPDFPLKTIQESQMVSRYELNGKQIEFRVQADASCFETALASLFAKYARELCMEAFNGYWLRQSGDLKTTAGYYQDGKRFIRDLENRALLPEDISLLIRNK